MHLLTWAPFAITVLMLLAIGYQARQRVRRVEAGLPPVAPPSPVDRRLRVVVLVILAAVAVWIIVARFIGPSPTAGASATLDDGMAKLNYLVGATWTCKDPHSGQTVFVMAFNVAAQNTLHEHVISNNHEADQYFGYSPTVRHYFVTMADSGGSYAWGGSVDGTEFSETIHTGVATSYQGKFSLRPLSSDTVAYRGETLLKGMKTAGDMVCIRLPMVKPT